MQIVSAAHQYTTRTRPRQTRFLSTITICRIKADRHISISNIHAPSVETKYNEEKKFPMKIEDDYHVNWWEMENIFEQNL